MNMPLFRRRRPKKLKVDLGPLIDVAWSTSRSIPSTFPTLSPSDRQWRQYVCPHARVEGSPWSEIETSYLKETNIPTEGASQPACFHPTAHELLSMSTEEKSRSAHSAFRR